MIIVRTVAEAVHAARALPRPLGLVPTMGALHAGHLALVARARDECAAVMASVFVNPLQFGPNEDFAKYPRAFPSDVAQLEAEGVALVFAPSVAEMYPPGFDSTVDPGAIATRYEGALRPGHFRGVATVCTKLFAIAGAERAYFGAKDAQQVAVLQRIVRDLQLPVAIEVVPTVRDDDGLALSSRNAYLSPAERAAAPGLFRALRAMTDAVTRGEFDRHRIVAAGRGEVRMPLREAYLDVVDAQTFLTADAIARPEQDRVLLAIGSAWLGHTRLLDNLAISVPARPVLAAPAAPAGAAE
jgi:pantoate--beta-alanine ligase